MKWFILQFWTSGPFLNNYTKYEETLTYLQLPKENTVHNKFRAVSIYSSFQIYLNRFLRMVNWFSQGNADLNLNFSSLELEVKACVYYIEFWTDFTGHSLVQFPDQTLTWLLIYRVVTQLANAADAHWSMCLTGHFMNLYGSTVLWSLEHLHCW